MTVQQLNLGDPSQPEVALDAFAQLNWGDCHKVFCEHFSQRRFFLVTLEAKTDCHAVLNEHFSQRRICLVALDAKTDCHAVLNVHFSLRRKDLRLRKDAYREDHHALSLLLF